MRYLLNCLLFMVLVTPAALAGDAEEVRDLLKAKIDAVVVLLKDKATDKPARNRKILDIVNPVFDYPTMAKLSLGKKYWPALNPQQQGTFSELFIKRLQESYLDKLDIYTDEDVVFEEPQAEGSKAQVPTTLISKGSRIGMLYKLYRTAAGWQIYDVEIGGVSVIQTYRSQFDGVLAQGTIDDLLAKLRTDGSFTIPEPAKGAAGAGAK